MSGLAETIALLAQGRIDHLASASVISDGPGRMTETVGLGSNPGGLRMFSYAPAALPEGAPLVVVLHGCGQSAEAHAASAGWIGAAERYGFSVLAPEQGLSNNINRCFNWFQPGDARRGHGEAASIAEMIGKAIQLHQADGDQVYVTGLSAGGAMAAVMLAAYPELFAGGAVIAGVPFGVTRGVRDALQEMRRPPARPTGLLADLVRGAAPVRRTRPLRLSIWHGDADEMVNIANAQDLVRQWTAVLGLPEAPAKVTRSTRRTRSVWAPLFHGSSVELNIVHAFGHGTPLSIHGEDGLGAVAPFMLEVEISSTNEIARFWGLKPAQQPARAATAAPAIPQPPLVVVDTAPAIPQLPLVALDTAPAIPAPPLAPAAAPPPASPPPKPQRGLIGAIGRAVSRWSGRVGSAIARRWKSPS